MCHLCIYTISLMRLMRHNKVLVHSDEIRRVENSDYTRENKSEKYGGGYTVKVNRVHWYKAEENGGGGVMISIT